MYQKHAAICYLRFIYYAVLQEHPYIIIGRIFSETKTNIFNLSKNEYVDLFIISS